MVEEEEGFGDFLMLSFPSLKRDAYEATWVDLTVLPTSVISHRLLSRISSLNAGHGK